MFKHALIMAAGRGSRMLPLTNLVPKAMAPLANTTLIASGIDRICKFIANIHVTVGYKGNILASHVIDQHVSTVFNTNGKGNAWWIYNTLLKDLNEPVVVLTCDNVIELDFELLYEEYLKFDSPANLLIPVKPVDGLDGDYIFHNNQSVTKLSRIEKSEMYCSGIQVVNPSKINRYTKATEDFNDVWAQLMKVEQLYASKVYPKQWYTVDTIKQLESINMKLFK
jgi:NDP-sugar pyrophosphorylase family protein